MARRLSYSTPAEVGISNCLAATSIVEAEDVNISSTKKTVKKKKSGAVPEFLLMYSSFQPVVSFHRLFAKMYATCHAQPCCRVRIYSIIEDTKFYGIILDFEG